MQSLKIITVVLGLAFAGFGYFIRFRKKFHLINGFEADFEAGRKDEAYAKRVGMTEFVLGLALLAVGRDSGRLSAHVLSRPGDRQIRGL